MADTFYLKRGQDINLTATFRDEAGGQIVIDNTYAVTSSIKPIGCNAALIKLTPTLSNGSVLIAYATDALAEPRYELDIIAKSATGTRVITEKIFMQLDQTITPLT